MTRNKFTLLINAKGKRVIDFTDYWDIDIRTYRRWVADETKHDKLIKLIEGMK